MADKEAGSASGAGAAVKRSFDIAFLTGAVDKLPDERVKPAVKTEESADEEAPYPKSAFQKVGSGQSTFTNNSSAPKGTISECTQLMQVILTVPSTDTSVGQCETL